MALSFDGEEHRFSIRRKPWVLNDTPYWIMQVPGELIPNHSAVLTEDTFRLMEAVLTLSGTYDEGVTTTVVREDGVRPVAVIPRPDGGALFLDRSRAVYSVRPGSDRPVFLSCMPESLDPSQEIGFRVAGHLAYAAISRPEAGASSKCQTEVYEFQVENEGYQQLGRFPLASSECFSAAAFDVRGKRVYLGYRRGGGSGAVGRGPDPGVGQTAETPGFAWRNAGNGPAFRCLCTGVCSRPRERAALSGLCKRTRRHHGSSSYPTRWATPSRSNMGESQQRLFVADVRGQRDLGSGLW